MARQGFFYSFLLAVLLVAFTIPVTPVPADQGGVPYVAGEVIVKYRVNASQADKDAIRGEIHGNKVKEWGRIRAELQRIDGMTVEEAIQRLQGHPKVEYVEPNYILNAVEIPNDPMFPQLYAMLNTGQTGGTAGADIHATQAWDVFTGSSSALVGVIDTGVDYNHPDLAANIWTNPGEIPANGIDDDANGFIDDIHGWDFYNNDNDPFDDNGHGSHVSGTIGAVGDNGIGVAGVNWHVKIMALKFLSGGGSGSTDGAISAVQYATMMGVKLTSNSWGGGGFSQGLYDAIADAGANNILFVAASGNNGANTDTSPHYPSAYNLANIVSVAATDHNDDLASFSNYGATTVDLGAPGVDILSTFPGNSYGSISGTSMATPHVSGALALMFGRFPAIGALDAKSLLLNFVDLKPSLAGKCVTGGRLNVFLPIADPDSIPPGQVTDLAVADAASNWMTLAWTAPGDDGMVGAAARYEMRYSMAPIDDGNWAAATSAPNPPDPGAPGTPESMQVSGLDFSTFYYFAVKAFDEFGNAGALSNIASGTTLGAPDIDVAPTSLSTTLLTGATETQSLLLSNIAPNTTLDFQIPLPDLVTGTSVMAEYVEVPKGQEDARPGILGLGGPDAFGYRWVDSDEAFGPTFSWTDISATGAVALSTGDDSNAGPFPIGFDFSYYGITYSSFRVCSNGWLSFTSSATAYGNQALPNGGAPEAMLAPFWDDLDVGSGDVYYQTVGGNLIVQWNNVNHYSSGGPYTFQAILNSDGSIVYQYLTMGSPDNSATVGMQNGAKTDGLTIAFNSSYVHANLAVRIQAVPQWATVAPVSGTILGPGNTNLAVTFDASGLLGGIYEGNVRIMSNDPDENPFTVPLTLHVIGAPDIAVDPTSYDFGLVFLGATPTTTIQVRNPGTDVLNVSDISFSDGAYTADQTAFAIPPHGNMPVVVTFAPTVVQLYPATMTVTSDDPDQPTVTVALAGEGVEPPSFSVTPTSLISNLLTGQAENKTLTLSNTGGSPLTFNLTADLGMASVTQYTDEPLGKDVDDSRPGILGSGGPDTFGYRWVDSDQPGGPAFNWVDISVIGTPIALSSDDQNTGPIDIGFTFPFYGNTFSSLRVCTNGFLSFTSTRTTTGNVALPNVGTSIPENLLAPFWDDLHFRSVQRARYYNDGTRFIVQYTDVDKYSPSGAHLTFQVILYPNGSIVYQYLTMTGTLNSATIGIQNQAKTDGLTVVYNANYVHNNLAIRFSPTADWLSATPRTGTVPPGGSQNINVLFNAEGLFGGRYEGGVIIDTNDPLAPQVRVPCTLFVTGAPDIAVVPTSLDFGGVFIGYPEIMTFAVQNLGTDLLTVSDIVSDNPAFQVDPSSVTLPFNLAPLAQTLVTVRFSPAAAGMQSGTLMVLSNDVDEATVPVAVTGEGFMPPVGSVAPDSLFADLLTGETEIQNVTVSNSGGSDLTYQVRWLTSLAVEQVPEIAPVLEKGQEDPGPGVLGQGGPDTFGYSWVDSDEPGGPVYQWVDISGYGTPVFGATADDNNQGPFPIGFNFPFYGNTFTQFRVCSNGWLSFTSTATTLGNTTLPSSSAPDNLLAAFWDDLVVDLSLGGQVYRYFDGSKLIVQYDNVKKYNTTELNTFQVILYPNGAVLYQYETLGATVNSATIGIQNATKTDGLTVVYNAAYAHSGLAIRIATVPDWLTVSPVAGTIPAGSDQVFDVLFSAVDMFGGTYDGSVEFLTNDPAHGFLRVAATMHVTGVPRLGVFPNTLDFGDVFIGWPESLTFVVKNIGTDHLSVTSVTSGLPDYTLSATAFELDPLQSATVTLTFDPTEAGDRSTMLTFVSNDPASPFMMAVAGVGVVPPEMSVNPDTLVAAAPPGGAKTKTMEVCNDGGSPLYWTLDTAEGVGSTQVYEPLDLPKTKDEAGEVDAIDPRPGILGSGGPDAFGYRWTDSDEPGGPAFSWVDISGVGTPISFGATYKDDGNSGPLALGQSFPFYGQNFNEFRACTNGWVSFTSTLTSYSNQPLPNTGAPENLLAAFWDDMVYDESYGSAAYYYWDGSRTIIQFSNMRRIATTTAPFYSYQILLYPNGNIVFQYLTLGATTNSCTIGIQNAAKDDGLTVAYNALYVHTNMAILFSARPAWLTVSPESGTVMPGECATLTVTLDAAQLAAGDYFGTVTVSGNDPANPSEAMEVVFHVREVEAVAVDVDPNTLNLEGQGRWVTGFVLLPPEFDPHDVVVSTVMLNGTVPADPDLVSYVDGGIQFKFDRAAVEQVLEAGDAVAVTITGEILDTAWFTATDIIRVIRPQMLRPNGSERVPKGVSIEIAWANPDGYTVESAAVFYSLDNGATWAMIAENIVGTTTRWLTPNVDAEQALVRVFLSDRHGVMGYDTSDGPFALGEAATGTLPTTPTVHALLQNAPNPFFRATQIGFDLPEDSAVTLKIYDVSGRLVRVLTEGAYPGGSHILYWDGRDTSGKDVAAGIYFYRIDAGSFRAVKRMILTR